MARYLVASLLIGALCLSCGGEIASDPDSGGDASGDADVDARQDADNVGGDADADGSDPDGDTASDADADEGDADDVRSDAEADAEGEPEPVFEEVDGLVAIEAEHFWENDDRGTPRAWYVTSASIDPGVTPDPHPPHPGVASRGADNAVLPRTRVTHHETNGCGESQSL